MARLLLAIPLPERLRRRLALEVDRLRLAGGRVEWIKPGGLHVILRHLGDVDDLELLWLDSAILRALKEHRAEIGAGPLMLVARGLAGVPDPRCPRLIRCGIVGQGPEGEEHLCALRQRLDARLREDGFHLEKGAGAPHIDLGRVRDREGLQELVERMGPSARREFGHFAARELILLEAGSGHRSGLRTPLGRFLLRGKAGGGGGPVSEPIC